MLADTLSVNEAAELIGKHHSTVRRWVDNGTVESTRLGAQIRVFRNSLLQASGTTDEASATSAGSASDRPAGGLFDPDWGLFTREPFHDLTPST